MAKGVCDDDEGKDLTGLGDDKCRCHVRAIKDASAEIVGYRRIVMPLASCVFQISTGLTLRCAEPEISKAFLSWAGRQLDYIQVWRHYIF